MPHIHLFLQELDHLYHTGDIDQYEQYWQKACHRAEYFFPGFTIAYAELSNSGIDRVADGAMRRHVLVPIVQQLTFTSQLVSLPQSMTAYTIPQNHTLSPDVAAQKAARRKVIEKARQLERDSYKAMIQRRCQLQGTTSLARIV